MEVSWQYENSISGLINLNPLNIMPNDAGTTFDKNSAYIRWFHFNKITENVPFEVPTCIVGIVDYNTLSTCEDELFIPIYSSTNEQHISGAESILKAFSRQSISCGLLKAVTPKGEIYYGCKGMILDKDYNILFLSTLEGTLSNGTISYSKRIIHINPLVFTNNEAILNKAIARKTVPFLLGWNYYRASRSATSYSTFTDETSMRKFHIVIDDVTGWLKSPNKPKDPVNTNEDLNKFIKHNIADILIQIKNDFGRCFR